MFLFRLTDGESTLQANLQVIMPCNRNVWHIQIGAHLGIFPMLAVADGCSGIAVEGNPNHIPYMRFTNVINSFDGAVKPAGREGVASIMQRVQSTWELMAACQWYLWITWTNFT
jgi:hypothetical protein